MAEVAEKYVKKGMQLYIEGRIRTRSWDDRDGNKRYTTEIVADNMQMLGKRSDDSQIQQNHQCKMISYLKTKIFLQKLQKLMIYHFKPKFITLIKIICFKIGNKF